MIAPGLARAFGLLRPFGGATPLGLFRAAFGTILVVEAFELLPHLTDWFSDDGVLPRVELLATVRRDRLAVFDLAGPPWVAALLWLLTVVSAAALALGFRARLAAASSFVLFAGIHERLPQVIDGSDNLARALLFWLAFAPASASPSLDARDGRGATGSPLAARLLQAQVAWVYLCTALHKLGGPAWRDGTAVRYAWSNPHVFSRSWVGALATSPGLVRAATWGTLAFELAWPLILLMPTGRWRRVRAVALLAGLGFHASIFTTIRVGMFSWLLPVTYLLFLDPAWLDAAPQPSARGRERVRDGLLALAFACVVWTSAPSPARRAAPVFVERAVSAASLWANWSMFAPQPIRADYVLRVVARRADGSEVLRDASLRDGAPGRRGFVFSRWWKFEEALAQGQVVALRSWARWWCRESARRNERFDEFTLEIHEREILASGQPWRPARVRRLWEQRCVPRAVPRPAVAHDLTPEEAARVPHGVTPTAPLAPRTTPGVTD